MLFFVCLSLATAQGLPVKLTGDEVAMQLGTAKYTVDIVVPTVRSTEVAEALRRAAVERHVSIRVLVDPTLVEAPDSFIPSTETYAGVEVRLVPTERAFVIIDNQIVLEGLLIAESAVPFDAPPTLALRDAETTTKRLDWFEAQWVNAPRYKSFINFVEIGD
jgi:hypothetical protein